MAILLAESFGRFDPPAMAVGTTPKEFEEFVRISLPHAASNRLTIIARTAETGEMVGALLTEDSSSPLPAKIDRLSTKDG